MDPDRRSELEALARAVGTDFYANFDFRSMERLAALINDQDAAAAAREVTGLVAQWFEATMIDVHVTAIDAVSGWGRAAELGYEASAAAARIEAALHGTMRARWGHDDHLDPNIRP